MIIEDKTYFWHNCLLPKSHYNGDFDDDGSDDDSDMNLNIFAASFIVTVYEFNGHPALMVWSHY